MPGEKSLARQWVAKAQSDFLDADNNLASRDIPMDTVCFHCQQAAEKLLKGFLVLDGRPVPRSHDLLLLLNECITLQPAIAVLRKSLVILNPYAVEVRYPDDAFHPTLKDAQEARAAAGEVDAWMKKTVPGLFEETSLE